MIFITLGSQKFQFNRVLKKIDQLIEQGIIKEEVFAQIGYSDYIPKNYSYKQFLDRDEFALYQSKCNILITHGGTGAIIGGLKKEKKVIAIARLSKYGEHVDDHQLQIIEQFKEQNLLFGISDENELDHLLSIIHNHQFNMYQSNTDTIINSIESFIDDLKGCK